MCAVPNRFPPVNNAGVIPMTPALCVMALYSARKLGEQMLEP